VFQILNILAPVFVIIALGAALFRIGFLTAELSRGINRLSYWVALPALLFQSTADANFGDGGGRVVIALITASVTVTIIATLIAWGMRLPAVTAGTFVHLAMRGNVSFIGVPVLFYIIEGTHNLRAAEMKSAAIIALAPLLLVQNAIGIGTLLAGQHSSGRRLIKVVGKEIVTHPLLIALALGLFVSWMRWRLPLALDRSLQALGATALPLPLLSIGASLMTIQMRGHRSRALLASMLKLVAMPLIGWGLGRSLGLDRDQLLFTLVYLATPTGASSFSLVAEMGGEEALASTAIALSTFLSIVPLALIVAWS
jgi:hypothetical protein